jgi:hypothetical protein
VGQVQDVGLIFLSAMGSSIAAACTAAGRDAATALGTALLTMSVATFFTGAACLLVAKQKLAQMVQYLPLPVIGGYLSFVGYFCLASGVGLGTSLDIGSLASWARLLSWDAAAKLAPTLASCAAMIATLERCSHPLALPGVLVAINLAFHAVRLALGVTMEQAMDAQWVIRPAVSPTQPAGPASTAAPARRGEVFCLESMPPLPPPTHPSLQEGVSRFWELWGLFNIHDLSLRCLQGGVEARNGRGVLGQLSWGSSVEEQASPACALPKFIPRPDSLAGCVRSPPLRPALQPAAGGPSCSGIFWPALTDQWVKMLGLALVVIFGSAMDIAAIQQDTPQAGRGSGGVENIHSSRSTWASVLRGQRPGACLPSGQLAAHPRINCCPACAAVLPCSRLQKIDFNRELVTVAVSNMATGVAGCGYTGSYIFRWAAGKGRRGFLRLRLTRLLALGPPLLDALLAAEPGLRVRATWALEGASLISDGRPLLPLSRCSQTIFTMRAGVYNRWNGWVVAISEFVMFALPFPGGMQAEGLQCVACWLTHRLVNLARLFPLFSNRNHVW